MKGFSMLEMIITLVIISILTVIAAPNIKSVLALEQLNQSSSDLVQVLKKAQSRAILESKVITVRIGTSTLEDENELSWTPSGSAYLRGSNSVIYVGRSGILQLSETSTAYAGIKDYVICSVNAVNSRKITFNRIGIVIDSGLREGCNAS